MLNAIFNTINPVMCVVFITFIAGFLFLNLKLKINQILFAILFINATTEILSIYLEIKNQSVSTLYNFSILLHHTLWLFLLYSLIKSKIALVVTILFFVFSVLNVLFFEGLDEFNCYTFVVGSLLYVILFLYESFRQLKKENLLFFVLNPFILIFAPVLFLLGMSFMFSFKDIELTSTIIIFNTKLYVIINYTLNFIYYIFILVYIYKERIQKNA